jgi:pimeloyl-ACP methyl ester carboxylesterase
MTMFASEPTLTTDDLSGIAAPTLVLAGDDDGVRLDHTCAMFLALPAGQLAVVPGASHAVPIEKPAEVAHLVVDFLSSGPPETFMPILRAAPAS